MKLPMLKTTVYLVVVCVHHHPSFIFFFININLLDRVSRPSIFHYTVYLASYYF